MPSEESNRLAPRLVAPCRNLVAMVSAMCFVPCRGCRKCRSEPRSKYATVYRVAVGALEPARNEPRSMALFVYAYVYAQQTTYLLPLTEN